MTEILRGGNRLPVPPELLVGIETSDDAAVHRLNDEQALIATTDFFMPIVDDPPTSPHCRDQRHFRRLCGRPAIMALALVGMPIKVLPPKSSRASSLAARRSAVLPEFDCRRPQHRFGRADLRSGRPRLVHPQTGPNAMPMPASATASSFRQAARVGILAAALKKDAVDASGYAKMIATTTQLNTPGPELAALPGVNAMTDVTGFGSPRLELARAPRNAAWSIDWSRPADRRSDQTRRGRDRHRRLRPQLRVHGHDTPCRRILRRQTRRCSPTRKPAAACWFPARRKAWPRCWRSSAGTVFAAAAEVGEVLPSGPAALVVRWNFPRRMNDNDADTI